MKKTVFFVIISFITLAFIFPSSSFAEIDGKYELIVTPPNSPPQKRSLRQVTIHEVFSFACPHCYNFNRKLPQLKEKFGKKIKIIPIPIGWNGHDPGRLFYIAETKGKGDEVKDMIFDFYHIRGLGKAMYSRDKLQFVAKRVGLSKEFKSLMDNPKIVKKMNAGIQLAKEFKVNSTPTVVIEGALKAHGDYDNLVLIINSLLKNPVK